MRWEICSCPLSLAQCVASVRGGGWSLGVQTNPTAVRGIHRRNCTDTFPGPLAKSVPLFAPVGKVRPGFCACLKAGNRSSSWAAFYDRSSPTEGPAFPASAVLSVSFHSRRKRGVAPESCFNKGGR